MSLFNITRWPTALVFLLAGVVAALFAFGTVNLFAQAMASIGFLQKYGWQAVQHGALWQVGELILFGAVALACWICFKVCEHNLQARYLAGAKRQKASSAETGTLEDRKKA
ncbi:MAG: hypothetical protein AAGH17_04665 [Pseudomonadota bacterium]